MVSGMIFNLNKILEFKASNLIINMLIGCLDRISKSIMLTNVLGLFPKQ